MSIENVIYHFFRVCKETPSSAPVYLNTLDAVEYLVRASDGQVMASEALESIDRNPSFDKVYQHPLVALDIIPRGFIFGE